MKKLFVLTLTLGLFLSSQPPLRAQDKTSQQLTAEDQEKKAEREKNAYRLLDQALDEAQSLRLTENRVRVQITGADLLWDSNQGRARSLFTSAADGVAELGRIQAMAEQDRGGRGNQERVAPQNMRSFQLRQELILAAARHDATLAYQLLAATKPPATAQTVTEQRGPRAQFASEENLEQTLLARIAALDPKLAAQNAELMIDKGQFPRTLPEVLNQLARQDPEAAQKLADKAVKKIQAANLLTNNEAGLLVQALLEPGPRQSAEQAAAITQFRSRGPVLDQSAYIELLSSVIDVALKATPTQGSNRPANPRRGMTGSVDRNAGAQQLTEAQTEQMSARRWLVGLQGIMPLIEQYLPAKAPLLQQKMTQLGMSHTPVPAMQPFNNLRANPNPTADALILAAAQAPPQMQSRLYQQAAYKALEEGDTERARKIANDHLQNNAREAVMQRVNFREIAMKADDTGIADVRQAVAKLQNDNEKINLLLQVAGDAQKNPKLAAQLLDEAKQLASRRASSYMHFDQQLKVAHAFATVDPARSFEILDPGISQLNELLSAAAVLSGFEINIFRDGEMSLQHGSGLTSIINRYGQELAVLARSDFERAETLAGRFQFPESRITARLQIVQGLLDRTPAGPARFAVRQD